MNYPIKIINEKNAGLMMFVGSVQWLMMSIILESFQPGYIGSLHYVSTLGVGTTAIIYNLSLILFGISIILASVLLLKSSGKKLYIIFLLLAGVFVIGVGVFPENVRPHHGIVTPLAFIFAVIAAISAYKPLSSPFSYVSLAFGLTTLVFLVIFFPYLGLPAESTIVFLGMTKGTIERIIIYLLMFWIISLSIYLMTNKLK